MTNQKYELVIFKVLRTTHRNPSQYSRKNTFSINYRFHNPQAEIPTNEYSHTPEKSESNKPKSKAVHEGKRKTNESYNEEEKCWEEKKLEIRVKQIRGFKRGNI